MHPAPLSPVQGLGGEGCWDNQAERRSLGTVQKLPRWSQSSATDHWQRGRSSAGQTTATVRRSGARGAASQQPAASPKRRSLWFQGSRSRAQRGAARWLLNLPPTRGQHNLPGPPTWPGIPKPRFARRAGQSRRILTASQVGGHVLKHLYLFDGFPAGEVNHQHPVARGKILQAGSRKARGRLSKGFVISSPIRYLSSTRGKARQSAARQQAPGVPVEQSVVQVFAEPLQHLVMVPDGRCLVFAGSEVALQLQKEETAWLRCPPTAHRRGRGRCQRSQPALSSFL